MNPIDPETLERIKHEAAKVIADTLGNDGLPLAAKVLERIDAAVADPNDPRTFVAGRKVTVKATEIPAQVVRIVEHEGEVHTVVVRFDDMTGEHPFSPRELEVVTPE